MHIFLLSSVYPSKYMVKGTTPVVHYFAKEWALSGHKVHVFHLESAFPKIYYLLGRLFKNALSSRLGYMVSIHSPKEYDEIIDDVIINHISLRKIKPHGRFSRQQINRAFRIISTYIEKEGCPDCFVGHWYNPQLEILHLLKKEYHRKTCLVYHNNSYSHFYKCFGNDTEVFVDDVDLVGFRSNAAKEAYEKVFGKVSHSFFAPSGVSRFFIDAGNRTDDNRFIGINNFVYVGALIARKNPTMIIDSLHKSYQNDSFHMTFIGDGDEKVNIQQRFDELGCKGELTFTGRIPREDVVGYLSQSDVFIMISKGEVFGLVYLEAMALGCITVAARNEGIDGIIEDGINGFLCNVGDCDELAAIISKIRTMSYAELKSISEKAKDTARKFSDENVANNYLDALRTIVV